MLSQGLSALLAQAAHPWRLYGAALGLRLLALLVLYQLPDPVIAEGFFSSAGVEFSAMAAGLVSGRGLTLFWVEERFVPSAFQPPLYPLFLSAVFATVGHGAAGLLVTQLAHVVVGAAQAVLLYAIGRAIFGPQTGAVAGWLGALYPALLYMPLEIHPITFTLTLTLAYLWGVMALHRTPTPARALAVGVAAGALALLRAEGLFLATAAWLVAAWRLGWPPRRFAWWGAAGALALLTPWLVRNQLVLGRPLLTTTSGYNLWRGQGELATGSPRTWQGESINATPAIEAALAALTWSPAYERQRDAIYRRAAWDYLIDHPWQPLRLAPIKLVFWGVADWTHPRARHPLYWGPAVMTLGLAGVGVWLAGRRRLVLWPLLLVWPAGYLTLTLIFFALPRYRLYAEPCLLLLAAYGGWHLVRAWQRRQTLKSKRATHLGVVSGSALNGPGGEPVKKTTDPDSREGVGSV